ncbi:hypothetical protein [Pedobacter arcticus]|uniref:hypothetical protein n=1 Tax=Pedobacter arcticus TaxID=752140 RepID=UPI0002FDCE48|nr:hypothetical protein [Pedobacter arcticus]
MNDEKVKELEAVLVHLAKRVEKLEGKTRSAPSSSYLKELFAEAKKILQNWH